jgi:hypothetical protein
MQHDFCAVDFRENEKFSSATAGVPALDGAYPVVPAVACVPTLLSSICYGWHPCCLRAQLNLCECMPVAWSHIGYLQITIIEERSFSTFVLSKYQLSLRLSTIVLRPKTFRITDIGYIKLAVVQLR